MHALLCAPDLCVVSHVQPECMHADRSMTLDLFFNKFLNFESLNKKHNVFVLVKGIKSVERDLQP